MKESEVQKVIADDAAIQEIKTRDNKLAIYVGLVIIIVTSVPAVLVFAGFFKSALIVVVALSVLWPICATLMAFLPAGKAQPTHC